MSVGTEPTVDQVHLEHRLSFRGLRPHAFVDPDLEWTYLRIVAIRDCRDREEALAAAGIG